MTEEDATSKLLASVRKAADFIVIAEDDKRGAEAYLQAYEYIVDGNPDLSAQEQRDLAMDYLDMTATPPLNRAQETAAHAVKDILADLQRSRGK
jgi:hypothetical protein